MKIALFMSTLLEQGGGLEKYLIETASALAEYNDIDVTVVTLDEGFNVMINNLLFFYYFSKIGGSSVKRESTDSVKNLLHNANYVNVTSMSALKHELKKYDVIYSKNELLEAAILKYLIGFKNLPPVIFGVHTPHYYPIADTIHAKIHNFLYCGSLYNYLCSDVTAFHVSNKQSFEILSKQFKNKKVFLINYPFDVGQFVQKSQETVSSIEMAPGKINILWLARLSVQKGVEDLVYIVRQVNSKHLDKIHWHLAGSGDPKYETMLTKLTKTFNNVTYHGHVPNQEVPNLLSKVDLFLSTSKWEVSPYNILEAQSMDKFVIANNIAGPSDIILSDQSGILCDSLDEYIEKVCSFINSSKRDKSDSISRSMKAKFSPEVIYPQLLSMFSSIAKA